MNMNVDMYDMLCYVYATRLDMYSLENRMLCMFIDDDLRFPNHPV